MRSLTATPSFCATYALASTSLIPWICIRATRSPAARIPPIPEASAWVTAIPRGSPTPTYSPSRLQSSTRALEAREVTSMGVWSWTVTPPTPIPMLAWMGMVAMSLHALVKVTARAMFQGVLSVVLVFITVPKILTPAFWASSSIW